MFHSRHILIITLLAVSLSFTGCYGYRVDVLQTDPITEGSWGHGQGHGVRQGHAGSCRVMQGHAGSWGLRVMGSGLTIHILFLV